MTRSERPSSDQLLADLLDALQSDVNPDRDSDASLDLGRAARMGVPEIILASTKPDDQVVELASRMMATNGRVLISRASEPLVARISAQFGEGFAVDHPSNSRMIRVTRAGSAPSKSGGRVAIFTAGTSDVPLGNEVRLVAEEMGCLVDLYADVGVAGLHRVIAPFRAAIDSGAGAIVVVAGMDGALPSVVSGLSPIPVIGLPSSVGYGFGGDGEAALMAMLQTCAPGLTVVNIDNSVGAGIAAARIANQAAETR